MFTIYLWCLSSLIIIVKSENGGCFNNVIDIATRETVENVTKYCENTPCVFRFCDNVHDILLSHYRDANLTCHSLNDINKITNLSIQLSDVNKVFKKEGDVSVESLRTFRNDFKHLKYSDNTNSKCTGKIRKNMNTSLKLRLLEDGSMLQHLVADNKDIIQQHRSFYVEYYVRKVKGKWRAPAFAMAEFIDAQGDNNNNRERTFSVFYKSIGLLVSCFFLTALLVIYGLFSQLRTLAGLILMAHVFTIDVGFLLKATINLSLQLGTATEDFCRYTSAIMYFSLISSFFWMNVMSFDIWWTFRGSLKRREINRRGIIHKFCMYSLYAFGAPLLILILATVIDVVDKHNTLKITKPKFSSCLHDSSLMYLYIPFTVMIIVNIVFFILTSVNIFRIKRFIHSSLKNNPNTKKNENRFMLYIKLFLITGINWIIDFILFSTNPPPWIEYIPDTYNMLIGVVIFAMYICKRKIFILLGSRFSMCARFATMLQPQPRSSQKSSSTKYSESHC